MPAWTIILILEAVQPHSNLSPVFPVKAKSPITDTMEEIRSWGRQTGRRAQETRDPRDTQEAAVGPVCPVSLQSWTMFKQTLHFSHYLCFSHNENNPSFSKKKKKFNQDTHTCKSQIKPLIILPQADQHYSSFMWMLHIYFSPYNVVHIY